MLSQTEIKSVNNIDTSKEKLNHLASSSSTDESLSLLSNDTIPINEKPHNYAMVVDDQSDIVNVIKCAIEKAKFEACIFTDPLAALFHLSLILDSLTLVC